MELRRARLLFFCLYLAEGAPIGFIWWALPTKLRGAGVDVERITALTAVLALPWALKFLWAPAVDALRSPRFGLAAWIGTAQLVMGAVLLPLCVIDVDGRFELVYALLLVHACAAATQDVAIDALCMAVIAPAERGRINGWMQAGMVLGRALFGGALLLVEARLGLAPVVAALVATIWGAGAVLWWLRPRTPEPAGDLRRTVRALWTALTAARVWLALLYAAVAGAAFEGAAAVAGPLLLDRGLSQDVVGVLYAGPAVAAMALGALAGGRAADRRGLRRTVMIAQAVTAAIVLALAVVDATWLRSPGLALALVVALYAGLGALTAASYALFMALADGPARATTFSAFMAMTNLCEMWSSRAVGRVQAGHGYALAFALVGLVSLAALAIVPHVARPGRGGSSSG